jgi:allantoate deiminase
MVHLTSTKFKQGNMLMPRREKLDADLSGLAQEVLSRCNIVAGFSEEPGRITRTFLCPAMRPLHERLGGWFRAAGMTVRLDAMGNLIGRYPAVQTNAPVFLIGSHLDSVPNAGRYDGVLGVLLGVAAVQALAGRRLPCAVDVVCFSEEEGIRFRTAYLGSLAVCGRLDPVLLSRTDAAGISVADALQNFGLNPADIAGAAYDPAQVLGYLEAHIEQGPVLDTLNLPVGVVEAIIGQSRLWVTFRGQAGHAGTLPMEYRHDALMGAAEWMLVVEQQARAIPGLRATVGTVAVSPGAVNVVPGSANLSLDLRHADDAIREQALAAVLERAQAIAVQRHLGFQIDQSEHHAAVPTAQGLSDRLAAAVTASGHQTHRLVSGAGHDAAVMAALTPMTMLFVRSPGGISHHPDEAVRPEDVALALEVMVRFLLSLQDL